MSKQACARILQEFTAAYHARNGSLWYTSTVTDAVALRRVVIAAAREFNAGRFFEAHEVLEEGLDAVPAELWELFIGLVQVAVGYHKVTQNLWSGARRMLELGVEKLDPFAANAAGLNVDALRRRARADMEALGRGTFDVGDFTRRPPRLQPLGSRDDRID